MTNYQTWPDHYLSWCRFGITWLTLVTRKSTMGIGRFFSFSFSFSIFVLSWPSGQEMKLKTTLPRMDPWQWKQVKILVYSILTFIGICTTEFQWNPIQFKYFLSIPLKLQNQLTNAWFHGSKIRVSCIQIKVAPRFKLMGCAFEGPIPGATTFTVCRIFSMQGLLLATPTGENCSNMYIHTTVYKYLHLLWVRSNFVSLF